MSQQSGISKNGYTILSLLASQTFLIADTLNKMYGKIDNLSTQILKSDPVKDWEEVPDINKDPPSVLDSCGTVSDIYHFRGRRTINWNNKWLIKEHLTTLLNLYPASIGLKDYNNLFSILHFFRLMLLFYSPTLPPLILSNREWFHRHLASSFSASSKLLQSPLFFLLSYPCNSFQKYLNYIKMKVIDL